MNRLLLSVIALVCLMQLTLGGELTFELPDNDKMCFYENIDKGTQSTIEFQVISGGNYDVDFEVQAPNGQILYKDVKKQYDSFTWTPEYTGIHTFCFSNEFSTFTHKIVYFDLQVGEEKPAVDEQQKGDHHTAMTMMETATVTIFESLKSVLDFQTHFRLREAQGRVFAEELNEVVFLWSIVESVVVIFIGIGQILVLRSFFSNSHKTLTAT